MDDIKIGIVGADKFAFDLYKQIRDNKHIHILFVCTKNRTLPFATHAEQKGIPVLESHQDISVASAPDFILNTTDDETIIMDLYDLFPLSSKTKLIDKKTISLFSDIFSSLSDDEDEDTVANRYLSFFLNNEKYAFEVSKITEIVKMQPITTVPNAPDFSPGIIRLRDRIIQLIDLKKALHLESDGHLIEESCIIVAEPTANTLYGFVVDNTSDVTMIDPSMISDIHADTCGISKNYIQGVAKLEKENCVIIDLDRFHSIHKLAEELKEDI